MSDDKSIAKEYLKGWNYHPDLPLKPVPVLAWPIRPKAILNWFIDAWFSISQRLLFVIIAIATWLWFTPNLERCKDLALGWIGQIYLRNFVIVVTITGALHLYFHTFSKQGKELKFDPRPLAKNNGLFKFRSQVWDNIFWTLASGLTLWTMFEVLVVWSMANGYAPVMTLEGAGVWTYLWFFAWFLLIPFWNSFHFYWVHRWLHWPPLYKAAHSLHHKNINVGPWSGNSMHPLEHLMYYSSILIHFFVLSHPIHILFHFNWLVLGANTSHCGFESLVIKDKGRFALGFFFHQLHHRHFECNYGTAEVPWDRWFGSLHDGTPESAERMRNRSFKKM